MARRFADQFLASGQRPTTRKASRVSVHRAITRTAIPRALHVIASFTNFPVYSLSSVSSNRSTLVDLWVQAGAGERIGDLPLVAKVARESTAQINCPEAGGASRTGSRRNPHSSRALMPAPQPWRIVLLRRLRCALSTSGVQESQNSHLTSIEYPLPYGCGCSRYNICGFV